MSAKPDVEQGMPLRRPSGTIEEQHRRRAEALKVAEHIPYDYDSATKAVSNIRQQYTAGRASIILLK